MILDRFDHVPGAITGSLAEMAGIAHVPEPLRFAGGSFGLTPNTGFYYGLPRTRRRCRCSTGRWRRGRLHQGDRRGRHRQDPALPQAAERTGLRGAAGASGLAAQPHLNPAELRIALALELGLAVRDQSELDLTDRIHRHLIALHQQGSRVVVLIDEAQALPDETLEAIRCLATWRPNRTSCCRSCCLASRSWTPGWPGPICASCASGSASPTACGRCVSMNPGLPGAQIADFRLSRGPAVWRPGAAPVVARLARHSATHQHTGAEVSDAGLWPGARQIDSRLVRLAVRDTDDACRFVPRRWWPRAAAGCALAYGVWQ